MFCQNCACELPAVAKYCVKCGSSVAPHNPPQNLGSFCANCGKPFDSAYKFCKYCGHTAIQTENLIIPPPPLPAAEAQGLVYCNYCGAPNPCDAEYCSSCGRSISVPRKSPVPIKKPSDAQKSEPAVETPKAPEDTARQVTSDASALDGDFPGIQPNDDLRQTAAGSTTGEARKTEVEFPSEFAGSLVPKNSHPAFESGSAQTETPGRGTFVARGPGIAQSANLIEAGSRFATFTAEFLSASALLSCAVFIAMYAPARNSWSALAISLLPIFSLLGLLLTILAGRTWLQIIRAEPPGNDFLKRRRRNVLVTATAVAVVFFSMAGVLGSTIGQNGAEEWQLESDISEMQSIGGRISKVRDSAESTIPSYVSVYESIESDVGLLDIVLHRLTDELAVYNVKFPERAKETSKSISGVNASLRRMALLKEQIAVAKKIEGLSHSEQLRIWQLEMQPLIDQEIALDNGSK